MWIGRGVLAALALSTATGCLPNSFIITPVSANRELQEEVLYGGGLLPDGKIAVLNVEGLILNANQPGLLREGEHPVVLLLEQLDAARRDPAVKAVVLRINSPGGTVTASEIMHDELLRFRRDGKPVVAMMMDVAASGGYYVACAADEIFACRSTITGSIGVVMQMFDLTGTLQKIGAKAEAIKSGDQKAAGSPFESLTPAQREVFQATINTLYGQFVDVVAAGRPQLTREQVLALADGRIFTADQALEHGLIDAIGSMPEALAAAQRLSGLRRAKVVAYTRPWGFVPNYYAAAPGASADVNLLKMDLAPWRAGPHAPFMYVWTAP